VVLNIRDRSGHYCAVAERDTWCLLNITAWSGHCCALAERDTWCLILQPGVGIIVL
jgi:hypothetical protein